MRGPNKTIILVLVIVVLSACSNSSDEAAPPPPDDVKDLIDNWFDAAGSGDGSVLDLYTSTGYHLYGTERFTGEDLVNHLGYPGISHEWISDLMLIVDGEHRYVVSRGMQNSGATTGSSALTFEILAQADGELLIAQSAWSKITTVTE